MRPCVVEGKDVLTLLVDLLVVGSAAVAVFLAVFAEHHQQLVLLVGDTDLLAVDVGVPAIGLMANPAPELAWVCLE